MSQQVDIEKILSSDEIQEYAKEKIKESIENTIYGKLDEKIKGTVENIVKKEAESIILKILSGPIVINDGWSKPRKYDTFEAMFKKQLHDNIAEIKVSHRAEAVVKEVVNKHIDNHIKTLVKALADLAEGNKNGSN